MKDVTGEINRLKDQLRFASKKQQKEINKRIAKLRSKTFK